MDWGAVVAAAITGVFGLWIVHGQRSVKRQVTPSNGKTVATIVEELRTSQLEVAVGLLEADRKILRVAENLDAEQERTAVDRVMADTDRNVMRAHIIEDQKFQDVITKVIANYLAAKIDSGSNPLEPS